LIQNQGTDMPQLIALVATAVLINGERTVIQPGQTLPELSDHDSRELFQSGAAELPAKTAYDAEQVARAAAQADAEVAESRRRIEAENDAREKAEAEAKELADAVAKVEAEAKAKAQAEADTLAREKAEKAAAKAAAGKK
jgi:colicin import membrane protein